MYRNIATYVTLAVVVFIFFLIFVAGYYAKRAYFLEKEVGKLETKISECEDAVIGQVSVYDNSLEYIDKHCGGLDRYYKRNTIIPHSKFPEFKEEIK